MNFNRPPQIESRVDKPPAEFIISGEEAEVPEIPVSREAYPGCLVEAMRLANRRQDGALEAVKSTIVGSRRADFVASCGRCGISMVRADGVVYGATKCSRVEKGDIALGELA